MRTFVHFKQAVDNVSAEMITMKGKRNISGAAICALCAAGRFSR